MPEEIKTEEKKKKSKKKRIILFCILGAVLVLIILAGIRILRIIHNPGSFFDHSELVMETQAKETLIDTLFPIDTEADHDTEAETDAQTEEEPVSPESLPYKTTNIMIMGIDAFSDGSTSSGTVPHTDVTMVISINFEKNTVDLISIQRDTFTTVPGYRGFYKFNSVFNIGGGMDDVHAGLQLTCRAAAPWLGGVSVPYYYAFDFEAVINIVDAIGGIDYDVDQPYYDSKGRIYDRGVHHLDGVGALSYLRIRQQADGLDKSRNTRQRKMLIAIFNKLKSEGMLTKLPDLISAIRGRVYTNTSLSQTAALLNYAKTIGVENIRSRAVTGYIKMNYDWAFAFVDQQERIDLLKEVYNVDAQKVGTCTPEFEKWLHDTGFEAIKHIRQAEKVLKFIADSDEKGQNFTEEQKQIYIDCYKAYEKLSGIYNSAYEELAALYIKDGVTKEEISEKEKAFAAAIKEAEGAVKTTTTALAGECGYKDKLNFKVNGSWYKDTDINEIYVDFA